MVVYRPTLIVKHGGASQCIAALQSGGQVRNVLFAFSLVPASLVLDADSSDYRATN